MLKNILDLILETQNRFFPGVHIFFIPGNWYLTDLIKYLLKALRISDRWYEFWCRFTPVIFGVIYMLTVANNRINGNLAYKLIITNVVFGILIGGASAFFYKLFKPVFKLINARIGEFLKKGKAMIFGDKNGR
ncbi:MAG: hypothetical protein QXP66_01830 [Candidatus Aenigmatarchaeota archaeon]